MKIITSCNKSYNSKMIMDYNSLRSMIAECFEDYEFVEFLWAHMSNNPNIIIGFIEPSETVDRYVFKYKFGKDQTVYSHTYSLKDIESNIRKTCGYFNERIK
jgi:hypothetical protein